MAKPIKTVSTVVSQVEDLGNDTKRFTLMDQDGWELPPFKPGAHIDVHLEPGLVRTYSLCNEPADGTRYVIAVKRERDGRGGSKFLHDRVRIGDRIGVSLPRGGIGLSTNGMNVFVAGGIGVTPFISAIRHLQRQGQTNYRLHWASRGPPVLGDMIGPAIEAGHVRLYDTTMQAKPAIVALVDEFAASGFAACCGPEPMLEDFEAAVEAWPAERKHVEMFTPPKRIVQSDVPPYELVLRASKKVATVVPEVGLLGTLEAMGVDVPVSCGGGICGACRTRWIEGPPIHRDRVLSPAERQNELILCVGDCAGPKLVLDL
ncbi:vanillate O-demethylase ferredoxin subunit [Bradyrhizobium sp. Rc3b]|uniref:PDR/VanB family oxidoreductase n=1 Tax=Bradyrhizobium sp. Rc3b TaxID=1855322 RepID=UPI0008E510AE|nr:PDR/VanB family oxidoreductase [Bradyrhizobium sp. Rc3b]SFN83420.1 vanillate O-demethylase ferredoxin subunit [Bradyrhizobium sp. Rc3b]